MLKFIFHILSINWEYHHERFIMWANDSRWNIVLVQTLSSSRQPIATFTSSPLNLHLLSAMSSQGTSTVIKYQQQCVQYSLWIICINLLVDCTIDSRSFLLISQTLLGFGKLVVDWFFKNICSYEIVIKSYFHSEFGVSLGFISLSSGIMSHIFPFPALLESSTSIWSLGEPPSKPFSLIQAK